MIYRDLAVLLPARPRFHQRASAFLAFGHVLLERLALGLPKLGKLEFDAAAQQREEKFLHAHGEQGMAPIVDISLSDGNQGGAERTLRAFGNDDLGRVGQVGGKTTNERELESARTSARFNEGFLALPYFVWHGRKRFTATEVAVECLRAEAHADKFVAELQSHDPGNSARIQTFAERYDRRYPVTQTDQSLARRRFNVLPPIEGDLPDIAGQEIQSIMERRGHILVVPAIRS